jgi:hypothetical protein
MAFGKCAESPRIVRTGYVKTPCIPGCGGIFERKEDDVLRENLVRVRNA